MASVPDTEQGSFRLVSENLQAPEIALGKRYPRGGLRAPTGTSRAQRLACSVAVASCSPTGTGSAQPRSPRQAPAQHLPGRPGKAKSTLSTTLLDRMETGGLSSTAPQGGGAGACRRRISVTPSPPPRAQPGLDFPKAGHTGAAGPKPGRCHLPLVSFLFFSALI